MILCNKATRRGALLVVTMSVMVLTVCSMAPVALAAGDSTLDNLIVTNPVPGWNALPQADSQALVSYEEKALSGITNGTVTAAAEGWQGQDMSQRLIIALIRFSQTIPFAERNAREGVISACAASTGNAPTAPVQAFAGIPGSQEAECAGQNSAGSEITATAISWARGNVLVFTEGAGLSQTQVESVAQTQDSNLPSAGVQGGHSNVALIVGVVVIVVVLLFGIITTVMLRQQTRRRAATTTVQPAPVPMQMSGQVRPPGVSGGWMPDPYRRYDQRYWSGTEWTQHVLTAGQPALDPLPESSRITDPR